MLELQIRIVIYLGKLKKKLPSRTKAPLQAEYRPEFDSSPNLDPHEVT